ncbi:MAG: hypothetical protein AAF658_17615, partial [Myxococcota bacterium]
TQLRIEEAHESDKKRDEQDELAEYYDRLRVISERREDAIEEQSLEGLSGQAERAVLQAGKKALRNSPHQAQRLSEGEIASIEGVGDPRLASNQSALTAMNATRSQIRNSLPIEIVGSSEYLSLVELTKPQKKGGGFDESAFSERTGMQGNVRSEVMRGRIKDLVERVDEKVAADEVERLQAEGVDDEDQLAHAQLTYHEVVDMMTRKGRRGEEVTPSDVQLVSTHRLRLMEGMRDYIPKWAPENPQRWISMGDRYVFDISLAAVPEELIKDTAAYEGMQDLMRGDALFTLRAADHAGDAVGRKSSEMRREVAQADGLEDAQAKAQALQPRPFIPSRPSDTEWLA